MFRLLLSALNLLAKCTMFAVCCCLIVWVGSCLVGVVLVVFDIGGCSLFVVSCLLRDVCGVCCLLALCVVCYLLCFVCCLSCGACCC